MATPLPHRCHCTSLYCMSGPPKVPYVSKLSNSRSVCAVMTTVSSSALHMGHDLSLASTRSLSSHKHARAGEECERDSCPPVCLLLSHRIVHNEHTNLWPQTPIEKKVRSSQQSKHDSCSPSLPPFDADADAASAMFFVAHSSGAGIERFVYIDRLGLNSHA